MINLHKFYGKQQNQFRRRDLSERRGLGFGLLVNVVQGSFALQPPLFLGVLPFQRLWMCLLPRGLSPMTKPRTLPVRGGLNMTFDINVDVVSLRYNLCRSITQMLCLPKSMGTHDSTKKLMSSWGLGAGFPLDPEMGYGSELNHQGVIGIF